MIAGSPGPHPAQIHRSNQSLFGVAQTPLIRLGPGINPEVALQGHVEAVYTPRAVTTTLSHRLPPDLSEAGAALGMLTDLVHAEARVIRSRVVPYSTAQAYPISDTRRLSEVLGTMRAEDTGKTLSEAVKEREPEIRYATNHGGTRPEVVLLARLATLSSRGLIPLSRKGRSGHWRKVPEYPGRLSMYALACHGELLKRQHGV